MPLRSKLTLWFIITNATRYKCTEWNVYLIGYAYTQASRASSSLYVAFLSEWLLASWWQHDCFLLCLRPPWTFRWWRSSCATKSLVPASSNPAGLYSLAAYISHACIISSVLHLAVMAAMKCYTIVRPLTYTTVLTHRLRNIVLSSAWVVAVVTVGGAAAGGLRWESNMDVYFTEWTDWKSKGSSHSAVLRDNSCDLLRGCDVVFIREDTVGRSPASYHNQHDGDGCINRWPSTRVAPRRTVGRQREVGKKYLHHHHLFLHLLLSVGTYCTISWCGRSALVWDHMSYFGIVQSVGKWLDIRLHVQVDTTRFCTNVPWKMLTTRFCTNFPWKMLTILSSDRRLHLFCFKVFSQNYLWQFQKYVYF